MNLSFVIDMNFSPVWVEFLSALGWSSDHWSSVGDPRAEDDEIMEWSRLNRRAVFTRDLDFATALALTQASGPSVVQVRGELILPETIGSQVQASIRRFESQLVAGALLTIESHRVRLRTLPFRLDPL